MSGMGESDLLRGYGVTRRQLDAAREPLRLLVPRCDAPLGHRDGEEVFCRREAWRVYDGLDGRRHGFCAMASHAWLATERYPAVEGTQRRASDLEAQP